MRSHGRALCNWQFEKCCLSNFPAMHCQFKDGCINFVHKRCSIPWSRTHGRNVQDVESVGRFCQEHYMTTTKMSCQIKLTMELNEPGHGITQRKTLSGKRMTCLSSLQMDFGLHPTAKIVSRLINIFTMVIRFVDTPGKHRDLIRQEITSFFPSTCWHKGFYKDGLKNIHPSAIVCNSINGRRHSAYHPLFCGSRLH
jgi:hypothetical protein